MRKLLYKTLIDDDSIDDIYLKILNGEKFFQIFINVHKLVMINNDLDVFKEFDENKCIFSVDGIWIKWLANLNRFYPKQRFGGLDVIEKFAKASEINQLKIYLLGSTEVTLNMTIKALLIEYPKINICGYQNGFYKDESQVIDEVILASPDILFIALPSPKKEQLGYEIFNQSKTIKYAAGVGGAFDIIAGISPRAPSFFQKIGLEWLYRVVIDPKRLFFRYFIDGFKFIKLILFN